MRKHAQVLKTFSDTTTTMIWYKTILMLFVYTATIVINKTSSTSNSRAVTYSDLLDYDDCFSASTGTNLNIEEIFMGRCYQFQYAEVKSPLCPSKPLGCSSLWKYFSNAWVQIDPCGVGDFAYQRFLKQLPFTVPEDGTVFWSGTYTIAHQLSNIHGLATLEDTMAGYLVNGLQWCGSVHDPTGIDYKSCPVYNNVTCAGQAQGVFWKASSQFFARNTKGVVHIVLNGSLPTGAYRKNSIFGEVELPNLNPNNVDVVVIVLVHTLGGECHETCFDGSLVTLQNDLTARGFNWTCVEDPMETQYLQCASNPDNPSCPSTQVERKKGLFKNLFITETLA